MKDHKMKSFVMNVLNGSAMGIVVALIPGAIFGELFKALSGTFPALGLVSQLLTMTNSFIGFAIGVAVAALFKLTAIESISIGIASMLSGGAVKFVDGNILMKGTGDIITMTITTAIAVGLIFLFRPYVKGYAVLVIPSISVVISATIGVLLLPYFVTITTMIGQGVHQLLTLEQTVMSILIAIVFAFLIVSPISSVGIALAINVMGVGSGAANLGICATMFALAIAGRRVNSLGICLAHVIGSPKISMANILTRPILFLPIAINAAFLGILASWFSIQGTPLSAGFGISGLVGPIAHLNVVGWNTGSIVITIVTFLIFPILLGFVTDYLFVERFKLIKPEYYKINI